MCRGDAFLGPTRPLHSASSGRCDHRLHQPLDGGRVGVVGAERGAHGGVQPALEQGAEDGGVDGAPVHRRRRPSAPPVGRVQRRHGDGLEQPAVEPGQVVHAERPPSRMAVNRRVSWLRSRSGVIITPTSRSNMPLGSSPTSSANKQSRHCDQEVATGWAPPRPRSSRAAVAEAKVCGAASVMSRFAPGAGVRLGEHPAQALAQLRHRPGRRSRNARARSSG
jgi:hypothetical protein